MKEETIKSVVEYGAILRKIHNRLVAEGKVKVVKGKVIFLNNTKTKTKPTTKA